MSQVSDRLDSHACIDIVETFTCDGARIDRADWVLQRRLIDVAGVLVGFTIIRSRRWVRVTAPVATIVFVGGTVALLARTLA